MDNPNATIIRKACDDFARRNAPAVFAVFDAAITWHVPGHGPLSGDLMGHDAIADFFRRTMELSGGTFGIDVHNLLADGEVVVVLVTAHAQRNGISSSFPEVHVWRTKNVKAIAFREYQGDE
jgi:ketosteroid isomerase-like protein